MIFSVSAQDRPQALPSATRVSPGVFVVSLAIMLTGKSARSARACMSSSMSLFSTHCDIRARSCAKSLFFFDVRPQRADGRAERNTFSEITLRTCVILSCLSGLEAVMRRRRKTWVALRTSSSKRSGGTSARLAMAAATSSSRFARSTACVRAQRRKSCAGVAHNFLCDFGVTAIDQHIGDRRGKFRAASNGVKMVLALRPGDVERDPLPTAAVIA